jgi:hypothetical protein
MRPRGDLPKGPLARGVAGWVRVARGSAKILKGHPQKVTVGSGDSLRDLQGLSLALWVRARSSNLRAKLTERVSGVECR